MILRLLTWLLERHPDVASVSVVTWTDVQGAYANHLENSETRVWS